MMAETACRKETIIFENCPKLKLKNLNNYKDSKLH